jgi:hypothetical protein
MFVFSLKNYNKNRIHSARGAKDVEIALDGRIIFKGEVTQACGNINASNDPSSYGEVCIRYLKEQIKRRYVSFYSRLFYLRLMIEFLRKSLLMMKCILIKKLLKMKMRI